MKFVSRLKSSNCIKYITLNQDMSSLLLLKTLYEKHISCELHCRGNLKETDWKTRRNKRMTENIKRSGRKEIRTTKNKTKQNKKQKQNKTKNTYLIFNMVFNQINRTKTLVHVIFQAETSKRLIYIHLSFIYTLKPLWLGTCYVVVYAMEKMFWGKM